MPEMFSRVVVDADYLARLEDIYSSAKAFLFSGREKDRKRSEIRLGMAVQAQLTAEKAAADQKP